MWISLSFLLLVYFLIPVSSSIGLFDDVFHGSNVIDMSVLKTYGFDRCLTDLEFLLFVFYTDTVDGATPESSRDQTYFITDFIEQSMSICAPRFPQDAIMEAGFKSPKFKDKCHLFDPLAEPMSRDTCFNELREIISHHNIKIPDIEFKDNVKILEAQHETTKEKKMRKKEEKLEKKLKKQTEKKLKENAKKLKKVRDSLLKQEKADRKKAEKDLKRAQKEFNKKLNSEKKSKAKAKVEPIKTSITTNHDHKHNENDNCTTGEKGYKLHWGHMPHPANYIPDSDGLATSLDDCDDPAPTVDDCDDPIPTTIDCDDISTTPDCDGKHTTPSVSTVYDTIVSTSVILSTVHHTPESIHVKTLYKLSASITTTTDIYTFKRPTTVLLKITEGSVTEVITTTNVSTETIIEITTEPTTIEQSTITTTTVSVTTKTPDPTTTTKTKTKKIKKIKTKTEVEKRIETVTEYETDYYVETEYDTITKDKTVTTTIVATTTAPARAISRICSILGVLGYQCPTLGILAVPTPTAPPPARLNHRDLAMGDVFILGGSNDHQEFINTITTTTNRDDSTFSNIEWETVEQIHIPMLQFQVHDTLSTITTKRSRASLRPTMVVPSRKSSEFPLSFKSRETSNYSNSDNETLYGAGLTNLRNVNSSREFIQFVNGTWISGVDKRITRYSSVVTLFMSVSLLIVVVI